MSMPIQKPGRSRQDYGTPQDLFGAIVTRFGAFSIDLAASWENTKCPTYYDEAQDSLSQEWNKLSGNLWLNPPYGNIMPWVEKAAYSTSKNGPPIFVLVPASVGSDWYRFYVEPCAYVLALSPRVTFEGCKDPYIKDVILACYIHGLTGFKTWRWK